MVVCEVCDGFCGCDQGDAVCESLIEELGDGVHGCVYSVFSLMQALGT